MQLDGEDKLRAACQFLEALQAALEGHDLKGPLSLEVAGLSHFRRQVGFFNSEE